MGKEVCRIDLKLMGDDAKMFLAEFEKSGFQHKNQYVRYKLFTSNVVTTNKERTQISYCVGQLNETVDEVMKVVNRIKDGDYHEKEIRELRFAVDELTKGVKVLYGSF